MKKVYVVLEPSKSGDDYDRVFKTVEEANNYALDEWAHLTRSEQAECSLTVYALDESSVNDSAYVDEEDDVEREIIYGIDWSDSDWCFSEAEGGVKCYLDVDEWREALTELCLSKLSVMSEADKQAAVDNLDVWIRDESYNIVGDWLDSDIRQDFVLDVLNDVEESLED